MEHEYHHALQGVALKAPAGSLEAIRAVPGVAAAFIERETRVRDTVDADAAGGVRTPRLASQDPDNLSSQVMMRTDRVTQKGEGTVIAIIDTGVDMAHSALSGTPRRPPTSPAPTGRTSRASPRATPTRSWAQPPTRR